MGRAGLEDLSLLLQPASDPYSGNGADNSVPPADGFQVLPSTWALKHFRHSQPPSLCNPIFETGAWMVGSRHHMVPCSRERALEHHLTL